MVSIASKYYKVPACVRNQMQANARFVYCRGHVASCIRTHTRTHARTHIHTHIHTYSGEVLSYSLIIGCSLSNRARR